MTNFIYQVREVFQEMEKTKALHPRFPIYFPPELVATAVKNTTQGERLCFMVLNNKAFSVETPIKIRTFMHTLASGQFGPS